jgi:alpha-L-fucosidase-like protein
MLTLGLALLAGCAPTEEPPTEPAAPVFTGDLSSDLAEVEKAVVAGPFENSWTSLEEIGVPEWYLDSKTGIFIYWGVCSVPAAGKLKVTSLAGGAVKSVSLPGHGGELEFTNRSHALIVTVPSQRPGDPRLRSRMCSKRQPCES